MLRNYKAVCNLLNGWMTEWMNENIYIYIFKKENKKKKKRLEIVFVFPVVE